MNKSTISITCPTAILSKIGSKHGDRSQFFTKAALQALGWRRYILLEGAIEMLCSDAAPNPLKGYKQIQKWRAEGRGGLVKASVIWAPDPMDTRYVEKIIYLVPGEGNLNWPI